MTEYLIKNADGSGWPAVHKDALAAVLAPKGWESEEIAGWGDHRIRLGGAEISSSGEEVGWQVTVEGELPAAEENAIIQTTCPGGRALPIARLPV
jgi:hypothetical protein